MRVNYCTFVRKYVEMIRFIVEKHKQRFYFIYPLKQQHIFYCYESYFDLCASENTFCVIAPQGKRYKNIIFFQVKKQGSNTFYTKTTYHAPDR